MYKVGDKVRVLVARDILGDPLDVNALYKIESFEQSDQSIWIELDEGGTYFRESIWNVYEHNIEGFDKRILLERKMDELTQLQREIAELEAELEGDAE